MLYHPHDGKDSRRNSRQPAPIPNVFRSDRRHRSRYCPSIEDKIVKFAEKESHQIFLEPEGRTTDEFYVTVPRPACRRKCSSK